MKTSDKLFKARRGALTGQVSTRARSQPNVTENSAKSQNSSTLLHLKAFTNLIAAGRDLLLGRGLFLAVLSRHGRECSY